MILGCGCFYTRKEREGTSLVVQWLRLPGQGTKSHMPATKSLLQLKILPASTKTQYSQINMYTNRY